MNRTGVFSIARVRLVSFAAVAVLHIMLLLFVAFRMEIAVKNEEPVAGVMKLVDVQEELPPPPPPDIPYTNTQESIAETMIETEVEPPSFVAYAPQTEQIQYLRQHEISIVPVLPEDEILRKMIYPPIAQRSNIEGTVFLELFIDRQGNVRDARILRENPPDRGFGEAAVNAFKGIKGKPAQANGVPVAVRYRYNLRFELK